MDDAGWVRTEMAVIVSPSHARAGSATACASARNGANARSARALSAMIRRCRDIAVDSMHTHLVRQARREHVSPVKLLLKHSKRGFVLALLAGAGHAGEQREYESALRVFEEKFHGGNMF